MDQKAIHSFMSGFRYGVVSSIAADGSPQSALVGIAVTPQLEIIFDTVKSSRKYPNLIARPRCSLVVGWGGEQTVQYEGLAAEPAGAELERSGFDTATSTSPRRRSSSCAFRSSKHEPPNRACGNQLGAPSFRLFSGERGETERFQGTKSCRQRPVLNGWRSPEDIAPPPRV